MSALPPRDAVDFALGVTLGALIGWGVATLLQAEEPEAPPGRFRPRLRLPSRRPAPPPRSFLQELRAKGGRLARDAGQELAQVAARGLQDTILGSGNGRRR